MGYEIAILALPVLTAFFAKIYWRTTINWHEMGLQVVIVLLVGFLLFAFAGFSQVRDVEIWNGQVTGKEQVQVSCEHSYQCNCVKSCSGSGANKSCTEICQTCYDHSYDWDWDVFTNIGRFSIDRVDRQGVDMPPRWGEVQVGEPVARSHVYTNYVKAVPESLFNHEGATYAGLPPVPAYPQVYDYYRVNRVLTVGVNLPNANAWNAHLSDILKELGPKKQANVTLVFVNTADQMYRHKLEAEWLGGKKNDVVVMFGVTDYPKIAWVDVMTFGLNMGNERFHMTLKNNLFNLGELDQDKVMSEIQTQVMAYYDRPQMKNFEYLKDAITPPTWLLIVIFILEMALSIGLTVYFHLNDVRLMGRSRW